MDADNLAHPVFFTCKSNNCNRPASSLQELYKLSKTIRSDDETDFEKI